MRTDNFIQLNRTFSELSEESGKYDDVEIGGSFTGVRYDWPSLLKEYRVVILSEAGSGKTVEIRNAAQTLREQGKAAFFLRLEHIFTDFESAFEAGSTYEEFQDWLVSDDDGWFLLDSVDEARLRDPRDFERAIRMLSRYIRNAYDRTHIVITSRITAWRPKTDREICTEQLPYAGENNKECPPNPIDEENDFDSSLLVEPKRTALKPFKIIALNDLVADQITLFVKSRGIEDSKAFLDAVERADAWQFTSRPQDLEELADFWKDNGRIGSRYEIILNSIGRRLAERDQNRAEINSLSTERAHYGAKILAAATTLTKISTITVPDGNHNSDGIAVQSVLPDWSATDQCILLLRPIFDEAIYGTVRFHHRSVREYLAAEWFAELLKRETSRRKIEALFFRNQYGRDIVTPTLRPILTWLVLMDEKIRNRVRKVAPEIFFEGGDPVQLPLDFRREILREACEQMADGVTGRSAKSYQAVQRFATQDLCDVIRELIHKYVDNNVLKEYLLRMVWFGKIDGLLPEAMTIALMPNAEKYVRLSAFRAVQAIGFVIDQERLRQSFLTEAEQLNREYLTELLKGVKPTEETWNWLLACLKKCEPKEPFAYSDHLPEAITQFVDATDTELLQKIITGLNELLDQPPLLDRGYCNVSKTFYSLIGSAGKTVERLMLTHNLELLDTDALSVLNKYSAFHHSGYDGESISEIKLELSKIVPLWPDLNRKLFWFEVQQKRGLESSTNGQRLTDFWDVLPGLALWKFDISDFEYVAEEIANQPFLDDKLVALSLAFDLYKTNGRQREWRTKLHKLCSGNVALDEQLKNYLKPPAQSKDSRQSKRRQAKWKKQAAAKQKQKENNAISWKKHFDENLDQVINEVLDKPGTITNSLWYLFHQSRNKKNTNDRSTDYNWKTLIPDYGEETAKFYRDSVVLFWRNFEPKLRSEGTPLNQIPLGATIGLTGLEIETNESPDCLKSLDDSEVERACRYATFELNGFPVWFQGLFEIYPEIVGNFLLQEIKFELSIEKPESDKSYIISDLSWSGQWAWNQLAPRIYELLKTAEPQNFSNLDKLLKILHGSNYSSELIAELACEKCKSLDDLRHLARWCAVWTCVDPEKAIPSFSSQIEKIVDPKEQTLFAMIFVTHLFVGRAAERRGEEQYKRDKFKNPAHLKTLYLLMNEYIRREDDINRFAEAVCYTPELRDDAQDARESLLNTLKMMPGKESYMALVEIAQKHHDKSARPWILLDAKTLAEQDGDLEPWTPMQVREFYNEQERTPSNHKELAELAIQRLLDLKDDLEQGDSSNASILMQVKEIEVRKYIANELDKTAHGRYSIQQEYELADGKKPDIRFQGNGIDAPVPVELKIADNWKDQKLFERLENQLCGDYLRDKRSGRGIFLLVYRGKEQPWKVPGRDDRLNFDQLVAALQNHWTQISPSFPNIEEIKVIGIDLTKRMS